MRKLFGWYGYFACAIVEVVVPVQRPRSASINVSLLLYDCGLGLVVDVSESTRRLEREPALYRPCDGSLSLGACREISAGDWKRRLAICVQRRHQSRFPVDCTVLLGSLSHLNVTDSIVNLPYTTTFRQYLLYYNFTRCNVDWGNSIISYFLQRFCLIEGITSTMCWTL